VIVLLQEPQEVQLRLRRAHEEDVTAALEGPRHLVKEARLVIGMIPDSQVSLVGVTVNVRLRRMYDRLLELLGVDLEDASLLLIDPYDCVLHLGTSSRKNDACLEPGQLQRAMRPADGP
jgi:hypothetical protein